MNLVVLRALDAARLASFYSVLGLKFILHRHGSGPEHYSCENEGMVFEIYSARDPSDMTREVRLGFAVDDVADAVARLGDAGAEVVSAPKESSWGIRAVIKDLEGHKVELVGKP